jgi:UDP-glucuronate decarboxylase
VAGGAGFLGSHLCEALLDRNWRVICVDNLQTGSAQNIAPLMRGEGFTFVRHDVCDPLDLHASVDRVYNLACAASPPRYQADPIHTMMTNVVGTRNLLAIAERFGARFLQASTSEVYGDPEMHPQSEDYWGHVNCTGPRACYDEGKRAAEALCFDIQRLGRADVRVARIFNTYGPRMRPEDGRIISNLIVQALQGKALTVYGNGAQTRSFCFVSDLVAGLMALIETDKNPEQPVNLGNPGEFTINELADMVLEMVDPDGEVVFEPLPQDDPRRRRPDITRARDLLGWQPTLTLAEGLPPTINWFRSQIEATAPGRSHRRGRAGLGPAGLEARLMRPDA